MLQGFNLSDDTVSKLQRKFLQFQNSRKIVHELILDYVADYRQFIGSNDDRKEFLEGQFRHHIPNFSHFISSENQIFWQVSDIAIIMGKNQSSISPTPSSIERTEDWNFRLIAIRKPFKSANGNSIFFYQQDIFDLIIDKYEEEYLLRFSSSRWGSKYNAPDLEEIKKVSGSRQTLSEMCPYVYEAAYSPHLASRLEGNPVDFDYVLKNFDELLEKYDRVIMEGSGGILCPIRIDEEKNIWLEDFIRARNFECILVADAGLGTINAVGLTTYYMKSRGLNLSGIIFNHFQAGNILHEDNLKVCEDITGIKIIACVRDNDEEINFAEEMQK